MRSDSFLDPTGHSVTASFAGNIKNNGVDTEGAKLAIQGNKDQKMIIDYNGNPVLSAYTPVDVHGIRWAVLSEIDVAEAFEPINALHWSIFFVILICSVIIVFVALFITKSIIKPLGGEPLEMKNISKSISNGDLTFDFDKSLDSNSVYGSMNAMATNLRNVVSEIIDSSNHLISSAQETSVLSIQSSESLTQQKSSIEQVATATEEMSTSINEVAHNATNAATSAQTAQETSNDANDKLTQTITDLGQLDSEMGRASEVIATLEADSHEIGSVLEVIRGIADQTNLLALNAAIEAARAGEQGRGFAVVADEVRNLASKTQESTKNIEDMIVRLQKASNDTVNVMKSSRDVCSHTLTDAEATANMINTMNSEINNVTQMIELIALAVEQQSSVSQEISQNIATIHDTAYENAESAIQVSDSGKDINAIASKLNELTHQFKVEK